MSKIFSLDSSGISYKKSLLRSLTATNSTTELFASANISFMPMCV